jgi:hypothetical protein
MSRWFFVVGLSLGLVFPVLGQTADPRMGTWKLNLAKSKYDPGPPPKSQMLKLEPTGNGGFKWTSDAVGADGQSSHFEVEAKIDGKRYDLRGTTAAISRTYKRVNARTVEAQDTFNGVSSFKFVEEVSADGRTLTTIQTGPNTQGLVRKNVRTYDKQ